QHFSYLSRGIYVNQLKAWRRVFSREQMLVVKSEELFSNDSDVIGQVIHFLGLRELEKKPLERFNEQQYPKMHSETRFRLRNFFAHHNERLYDFLGVDYGWTV